MIEGILLEGKKQRAEFARDLAYITEMSFEDTIADIVEKVDGFAPDTLSDYQEAVNSINTMKESYEDEDAKEIETLMESTKDSITFEEMIGIEDENVEINLNEIF